MRLGGLQRRILELAYWCYMDWRTYSIPTDFDINSLVYSYLEHYPENRYNGYHSCYSSLRNCVKSLMNRGYITISNPRVDTYKLTEKGIRCCEEEKFPKFVPP